MVKKERVDKEVTDSKDKSLSKKEIEEKLIDNFISLQKVMTNLAVKFDDLSNNISKLLELFEISAKTFAEKYKEGFPERYGDIDTEFLRKLDSLLEQNKVISKGIMLMEEKVKERNMQSQRNEDSYYSELRPRPLPRY